MKVAPLRILVHRLALLVAVPASMNVEAAGSPTAVGSARSYATRVNVGRWPSNLFEYNKRIHLSGVVITPGRNTSGEPSLSAGAPIANDLLAPFVVGKPKDDTPPKKVKPDNHFQVICTFNADRALCRYASMVNQHTVANGRIAVAGPRHRIVDQSAPDNDRSLAFAALDARQLD